jgi:hypothetical protein
MSEQKKSSVPEISQEDLVAAMEQALEGNSITAWGANGDVIDEQFLKRAFPDEPADKTLPHNAPAKPASKPG